MIIITSPPEHFSGEMDVPGDKSITHRALMLGSIARGVTEVRGFLDAEDCRSTMGCLNTLGATINVRGRRLFVHGKGGQLQAPTAELDAGNSGTTARLLAGILAGSHFESKITGDSSLQQRPMKRIVEPLKAMGAEIEGAAGGDNLPLTIKGKNLKAVHYKSPKASAQVKSAVLLAALYAEEETVFEEPYQSRDHTELMLKHFGAQLVAEPGLVKIKGRQTLQGKLVLVPGDISTAAFFMVAAAILPGSEVLLKNVGVNPTRTGIIDVLKEMGAHLEIENPRKWGMEPVGNIRVKGGRPLKGVEVKGEIIPRLIDEIPILAVAAAVAEGETIIGDASELRVKESDRISDLAGQLKRLDIAISEKEDGFVIRGGKPLKGAELDSCGDHRIAMALAVAGLVASGETAVNAAEVVAVSFPGFMQSLRSLCSKKNH